MAESEKTRARLRVPIPAVAGVIVLLLVLGAWWAMDYYAQKHPPKPPTLTQDARAYVRAGHLQLGGVEMKAAESYLKQLVVEITGKITNSGDKTLTLVELNCVFYDPYGQVILRERVPIVGRKTGALPPGQTKSFRLAFDNVPGSWNHTMPQLVIAQIVFG